MFQKYLNKMERQEIFPNGTEVFLGVTLVKKDGEWKQKSAFAKVNGLKNTYKSKKKDKTKYNDAKSIKETLDNVQIKEMKDDDW